MNRYLYGVIGVIILLMGSVIYKQQHTMVYQHFPIPEELSQKKKDPYPLYLFLFYSKKNCWSCLVEIVEVLKTLPPQFFVAGIAPDNELKEGGGLKNLAGTLFPLFSYSKYKRYLPYHTPTLYGVSPSGRVIFVLPMIHDNRINLRIILTSIYGSIYTSLKK